MACIFCGPAGTKFSSVEHIVPESLGNKSYILPKGVVCDECNNKFSYFEGVAQMQTILGYERARLAVKTKKKQPSKGQTGKIGFTGSSSFTKQIVQPNGFERKDLIDYDLSTGIGKIRVDTFTETSAVDTSKFLLKIGFESLYKSKPEIFNKYDFTDLKAYVSNETKDDWPFIMPNKSLQTFQNIPARFHKYSLKKIPCELSIKEIDEKNLIFKFQYGGITMKINLLNRTADWIKPYADAKIIFGVYPNTFSEQFGLADN